jgi:hypothetical protein
MFAQESATSIAVGAAYPVEINNQNLAGTTYRLGLSLGLSYRKKDEKGNTWAAGATYQSLRSSRQITLNGKAATENETFEFLHLEGFPLVWYLDKKERVALDLGAFFNFLLHEETEVNDNIVNNTKQIQRSSLGPSAGLSIRLGDTLRRSFQIGLRNDLALVSLGKNPAGNKAKPLKFNTLTLFVGLAI